MSRANAVYICGGDLLPGPRGDCGNELHDWPLPSGYVDAAEVAGRRIRNGWKNVRCPECDLYGWREGDVRVPTSEPHVSPSADA